MRIFPEWTKTTLREDKEIYRALLEAVQSSPSDEQIGVLTLVKQHHLDGNRDLTRDLYESFKRVLSELNVDHPAVAINHRNPEAGSWYQIPGHGKLVQGVDQKSRLASRQAARRKRWENLVDACPFSGGELDLFLAPADSRLDEIQTVFSDEINRVTNNLQEQIDDLNEIVCSLVEQTGVVLDHKHETFG